MLTDLEELRKNILKTEEEASKLREKRNQLNKEAKKWLEEKLEEFKEAPPNFFLLVNHHLQLVLAEKDFLKSLIKVIKKK